MRNKTYMWLTVGISLLVLTSTAVAQEEQWLQYHSEGVIRSSSICMILSCLTRTLQPRAQFLRKL